MAGDNDNGPENGQDQEERIVAHDAGDGPMVFIIIGKGYEVEGGDGVDLHILLAAADDDQAVRDALEALSEEGFIEADLDQIGLLTEVPEEEPHAAAYQGALGGEVAIIRFE